MTRSTPFTDHSSPILSVVLATRNEELNLARCLESAKNIADETIVVDEYSSDKTVEIAKKYGAKVYLEPHNDNFHITKQKALDKANGDWILQLDADEVVTRELAKEIKRVVSMTTGEIKKRGTQETKKWGLFRRHQEGVERRDGQIGKKTGEVVGFFIPRRNMFLGKPLVHAGVYPDGVIRLVKKGKAWFPQESVHEQIQLNGEVAWLENDLEHHDSPTFSRYIDRLNRYTDLRADEFRETGVGRGFLAFTFYLLVKPLFVFLSLFVRHKGFLEGTAGFVWSLFSALHYPLAYFKYWQMEKK